jgi:hypothetical protein
MSCNSTFNTKSELALHIDQLHILEGSPAEQLPADNHWIIQEDDVSEKFYQYRCFCIEKSKTTNLALEENFNEILSMSGILVLQKRNDYQVIPKSIFSPELLQEMRSNIMNSYQRECFNPVLFSRLNTIIQQYNNDDISETQTKIRLLTLSEEANENERSVICAIVELIPNLYDCNMKTLSEAHLAASFVHPFIHGLLSSKQPSKVAHCSNVVADENKDTNNRPDYKVDIYAQEYRYSYTNAYGEIKPSSNVSPTLLVNDFYRLAIFSKDAIDAFNLNQVLSFQVIGSCITFFSMSLSYHHLYTYTELARLHIPTKKSDLLNLIGHLDNLVFISLVHKNFCQPSDVDLFELSCDTLSSSYLENPKETMATRKRHCSLTIDN